MKIIEMHVTPIAFGDPPLLNAAGLHAPFALRTVIELVTDDGLYGLGEVPGGEQIASRLLAARLLVIGHDPFDLNAIEASLAEHLQALPARQRAPLLSAIEVACFDLMGKATGRPVVDLLGGRVRDRVDFSAYLFYKYEGAGGQLGFDCDPRASGWAKARQQEALDAQGIVDQAQAMSQAYGFKSLKLKGGVFAPEVEVETMLALRQAFGPEVPLRLDPNAVWSLDTARHFGKALEGVLEYYEDPVRGQASMAKLKEDLTVPLATNMCTTSFEDLPGAIALGSEDIILSDHHFWGGLRATLSLAAICQTFGRGLSMHSNSHLGISLAAMVHVAAALPNLSYACDTHYPWQNEELISRPLSFENGSVRVPQGPGLGIDLDREGLARLHENYLRCGLTQRDDELAMQAKQPGWTFASTRW
jgi:glucarate dehydratase